MLAKRPQINIVSREVTLATGEVVQAFFAVIENNGVREIKFLGTKPIQTSRGAQAAQTAPVLSLAAPKATVFAELFIKSVYEYASPFFSLDFLVNQLARAPSFKS
ncbi:MAG TPA: hypothetical protein VHD69_00070 [Candidatus Paceibacterota bacterium]|nr:hypothetical protein [Candidatus Paceibacterota bacterium]